MRGKLGKKGTKTNSHHIWHLKLDYIGGRQVLSTLDHPCPPNVPLILCKSPLTSKFPFLGRKLISPSPRHPPSYSSQQN